MDWPFLGVEALAAKAIPVYHPNIMDALLDHAPHLIPEALKTDEQGGTRYTFWWAVIYEHADGRQFVRFCYFCDGTWNRSFLYLGYAFDRRDPAARAS